MALPRLLRYAWASPATAIGLQFVLLALVSGGKVRVVRGAIEIHGGWAAAFLRRGLPCLRRAAAMTLGHVIIGLDQGCLNHSRRHEHVHVRQYERWGPLMLPLYLAASLVLYVRGHDPYLDNPFEREAYEEAP